jgi:hypothetical protein
MGAWGQSGDAECRRPGGDGSSAEQCGAVEELDLAGRGGIRINVPFVSERTL